MKLKSNSSVTVLQTKLDHLGIDMETLEKIATSLSETPDGVIRLLEASEKRNKGAKHRKMKSKNDDTHEISHNSETMDTRNVNATSDKLLSYEEVKEIEEKDIFYSIPMNIKRRVYEECRQKLTGPFMDIAVCSVCDEIVRIVDAKWVRITDSYATRLLQRLCPTVENVSSELKAHYDISQQVPCLKGALLSPKSDIRFHDDQNRPSIATCTRCLKSLLRPSDDQRPPKFSIANGFYIGELPSYLKDVSQPEIWLTSLATVTKPIVIVKGGQHRAIRSHVVVFDSNPLELFQKIDSIVKGQEKFVVIFTTYLTSNQEKLIRKRYRIRHSKVISLLHFFMKHHKSYAELANDFSSIESIISDPTFLRNVVLFHKSLKRECNDITSSTRVNDSKVTEENMEQEGELVVVESSSIFVDSENKLTVEAIKCTSEMVLDIQRRGKLLSDKTPDLLSRIFPDLFPFGEGHPGTKRLTKVSFEKCCQHYLLLSSRKFAQHPWFPLVAFDMISRRRALNTVGICCRFKPSENATIASVSAQQLAERLSEDAKYKAALRKGQAVNRNYHKTQNVIDPAKLLLRKVGIATSKCFGSNEERKIYQRRAWNLAAKYQGAALFVTLSPNENGSEIVSFYAGKVTKKRLIDINLSDVKSYSERVAITGSDPVACSLFFSNFVELFFGNILGFDLKRQLPYREGGLFGIVKAFFGGVESQAKQTLHFHAIVYLAGLPRTCKDFETLCAKEEFRDSLVSYIDSIIQASTIIDIEQEICLSCKRFGVKGINKFPKEAYRKAKIYSVPHVTCKCNTCGSKFCSDEMLRSALKRMSDASEVSEYPENLIPIDEKDYVSDQTTLMHLAVPKIPPFPSDIEAKSVKNVYAIRTIQTALLFQKHNWRHADSCFKKSSQSSKDSCRYGFPRMPFERTEISTTKEVSTIKMARKVGNEYINHFNDVVLNVFRSNHDIRLLIGSSDEAYYALKYALKYQNETDDLSATFLSTFYKRREREMNSTISNTCTEKEKNSKTAFGRIASLALARSAQQEIGGPLAVYYIMNESSLISSHNFIPLHLHSFLDLFEQNDKEELFRLISDSKDVYKPVSFTVDYIARPKELESVCLYKYVELYCLQRRFEKKNKVKDNAERELSLLSHHPQHQNFIVRRRELPCVPDIIGPRLQDLEKIKEDCDETEREEYSKRALTLFKPFRSSKEFLQKHSNYTNAFEAFKETLMFKESEANIILENIQEYYNGKRRAKIIRKQLSESQTNNCDSDTESHDSPSSTSEHYVESLNIQLKPEEVLQIEESGGNTDMNLNNTMKEVKSLLQIIPDSIYHQMVWNQKNDLSCKSKMDDIVKYTAKAEFQNNHSITKRSIDSLVEENLNSPSNIVHNASHEMLTIDGKEWDWKAEIDRRVSELKNGVEDNDNVEHHGDIREFQADNLVHDTFLVRRLEESIRNGVKWPRINSKKEINCSPFATPEEVANAFSLNEKQSIAFDIASKALLKSFKCSLTNAEPEKPLRLYIGGQGGTGKSRIIKAIQTLAEVWGRKNAVQAVAPTGKAASLIGGETVHSFFRISNRKERHLKISDEDRERFGALQLILWDEISMSSKELLAKAINHLNIFLDTQQQCRVHIIVIGDFLQLPPVLSTYIFEPPCNDGRKRKFSKDEAAGFILWREFDKVVILDENMRQQEDETYSAIMKRLRVGTTTIEDLQELNKRCLSSSSEQQKSKLLSELKELRENRNLSSIYAVQNNKQKNAINWQFVLEFARERTDKTVFLCPCDFKASERSTTASFEELKELYQVCDSKLERLQPVLPLFETMQVQITQNVCVSLGVSNGSIGTVAGINFSEHIVLTPVVIDGVKMVITSELPEAVFINIPECQNPRKFSLLPSEWPITIFPILPYEKSYIRVSLYNKNFSLSMKQIPLTPCFAATVFKLQGETVDGIIIYSFRSRGVTPTSLYVMLSRVKSLDGLFLLEPLTKKDLEFFKPPEKVLKEEERLKILSYKSIELINRTKQLYITDSNLPSTIEGLSNSNNNRYIVRKKKRKMDMSDNSITKRQTKITQVPEVSESNVTKIQMELEKVYTPHLPSNGSELSFQQKEHAKYFEHNSYVHGSSSEAIVSQESIIKVDNSILKDILIFSNHAPEGNRCSICMSVCHLSAAVFEAFSYRGQHNERPKTLYELTLSLPLNVSNTRNAWFIYDVPGDGNCWIYSICLSIYYYKKLMKENGLGSSFCQQNLEPQYLRTAIANFLCSMDDHSHRIISENKHKLCCRALQLNGSNSIIKNLSTVTFPGKLFTTAAYILKVSTPYHCTWAGNIGLEFTLAATVLKARILVLGSTISEGYGFRINQIWNNSDYIKLIPTRSSCDLYRVCLFDRQSCLSLKNISIPLTCSIEESFQLPIILLLHVNNCHFMAMEVPFVIYNEIIEIIPNLNINGIQYAY